MAIRAYEFFRRETIMRLDRMYSDWAGRESVLSSSTREGNITIHVISIQELQRRVHDPRDIIINQLVMFWSSYVHDCQWKLEVDATVVQSYEQANYKINVATLRFIWNEK